jgi:hypothetical protein
VEGQWDQKFFSQIAVTDEGRRSIQDMMLVLARVFLRVAFSNKQYSRILLRYAPDSSALCAMIPKELSVNIIVMAEYNVESIFSREVSSASESDSGGLNGDDYVQVEYLLSSKTETESSFARASSDNGSIIM